jgi:1-acyl-sn-glycerol-3-phosphate acyltransferase
MHVPILPILPRWWPLDLAIRRQGDFCLTIAQSGKRVPFDNQRTLDYQREEDGVARTDVIVPAGPPIDLSGFRRRPVDGPLLREVTDRVMGQLRDLLAEVRQEQAS